MPSKSKTPKKPAQQPLGSPRTGATQKKVSEHLQKPTNRELIASKLNCDPEAFLVYREFDRMDDPLCRVIVAILPDGRKYKFNLQPVTFNLELIL